MARRAFILIIGILGLLGSALVPTHAASAPAAGCAAPAWHMAGRDEFPSLLGGSRSQGVTTDGSRWWFSWQFGLQRTNAAYQITLANPIAIPPALLLSGSNHIGDIDLDGSRLIAPLEDGGPLVGSSNTPPYQHPWLVVYNARTLLPTGEGRPLPAEIQSHAAWVAVDHAKRLAITPSTWDDTTMLNVWDIDHGFRLVRRIPLARPVDRIQGAKVWGQWLYGSQDDDRKTIVRMNLLTGAVEELFHLGFEGETEGIALTASPSGLPLLHVLFVRGALEKPVKLRTTLYHLAPHCSS